MPDWNLIVAEHGTAVWRCVYRLLGDEHLARDCYQETFLAAMRARGGEPVKNWSAMLRAIATRKALDVLRARCRERQRSDPSTSPDWLASRNGHAPGAAAEAEQLRHAIRLALTRISPRQAEAFAMRHFEEMNDGEIADRMNTSARNVQVLVHRAAAKLRDELPDWVHEDALPGVTP
ncbi:MAG: sigma-70 family RNA polymerase sigma factor [Planctomycetota bacterium]